MGYTFFYEKIPLDHPETVRFVRCAFIYNWKAYGGLLPCTGMEPMKLPGHRQLLYVRSMDITQEICITAELVHLSPELIPDEVMVV